MSLIISLWIVHILLLWMFGLYFFAKIFDLIELLWWSSNIFSAGAYFSAYPWICFLFYFIIYIFMFDMIYLFRNILTILDLARELYVVYLVHPELWKPNISRLKVFTLLQGWLCHLRLGIAHFYKVNCICCYPLDRMHKSHLIWTTLALWIA